jgi:hypothetical protein
VWVSYFLKDKHVSKAVAQIGRIGHGGDTGIVSTLVLLELIDVIRKRITQQEQYAGQGPTVTDQIKTRTKQKVLEVVDKMTKLAWQGRVMITDPDVPLKEYVKNTYAIISKDLGDVGESDYCFTCQRSVAKRYKYQGPGHYDVQHAINARDTSADEIVSFDRAFDRFVGLDEFSSLKVTVL